MDRHRCVVVWIEEVPINPMQARVVGVIVGARIATVRVVVFANRACHEPAG